MLQVLFIGALAVGSLWVVRPFVLASIWATTIVVATWPLMLRVERWLGGRRGLAVAAMTAALLLVLVVPLCVGLAAILGNTETIVGWSKALAALTVPPPPGWVGGLPLVGKQLDASWMALAATPRDELPARLTPYVRIALGVFVAQVGSLGMMLLQFLLTTVVAAILYSKGEVAVAGIRRFVRRLIGAQGDDVVLLAGQAVRAVAMGVVVTAMVQSALGGLALLVAGIPFAMVLTAAMFLLAIAQIGVVPVFLAVIAWLYWAGDPVRATGLLVWAVLVGALDNVMRPVLIRKGADLPLLLIFAGVIGGLLAFGILGLFLGPVLLAVTYTLLVVWIERGTEPPGPAPMPADPAMGGSR